LFNKVVARKGFLFLQQGAHVMGKRQAQCQIHHRIISQASLNKLSSQIVDHKVDKSGHPEVQ
jgi:hypothetical protein